MITDIFEAYGVDKDLTINLYTSREVPRRGRPRFGLMLIFTRARVPMKDAYSSMSRLCRSQARYNKMFVLSAALRALGLKSMPEVAESGPIGGRLSPEFIILASDRRSEVYATATIWIFPVPARR